MTRRPAGFTLLELIIALAIVGALLVVAFGGMRVAIAAWSRAEDRADAHQHLRGLAVTVTRALGGAYPYRGPAGPAPEAVLLFTGTPTRVEFVTQAAPFPFPVPIAFTATVIAVEDDRGPALVIRERPLPNRDPFTAARIFLRDPGVRGIEIRYLDEDGAWQERWDGEEEQALPRAVRITFSATQGGRAEALPPLTIALRTAGP